MQALARVHDIPSLEALQLFAAHLLPALAERQVLLLEGPMGAGKTAFTRALLEELGSSETVSPSFAIHNQYTSDRGPVDHVDLYRLQSEDELESSGFWDLFAARTGLIIIEWPERLPVSGVPKTWQQLRLKIEITGATSRRITVDRV